MTKRQALTRAATILAETYRIILARPVAGLTERQLAHRIRQALGTFGASALAYPTIVGSGPGGAEPHHTPGLRRIRRGDLVVLDFAPKIDGWCADQTRTIVIGTPTARQKRLYELVRHAQRMAIRAVRPGVQSTHIDRIARDVIKRGGMGKAFIHSTGHGLGKHIHVPPWLTPHAERSRALRIGDIITVEPGVYVTGWGGIRIEDMIEVTASGHRTLTTALPSSLTALTVR